VAEVERQRDAFSWKAGAPTNVTSGGPGDRFIMSQGWKSVANPDSRPQRWSTGAVEVSSVPMQSKAGTLLESGQGGGLTPVPQVIPGIVQKLQQPLTVAELLPSQVATTSSVRYVVEGTATSGAAGVAEGGLKPPSDLTYSTVDEAVKKIATTITLSDELAEDAPAIQQYINGRLSLFVSAEEDRELLRGAGTNELVGLFNRSIPVYARGTVDNNAVALLKAMSGTRGSAHLEPDAIIMHPDNWLSTRLLTDSNGQFFGGGPYSGPYGGPAAPAGAFQDSLWGKPVVLSTHVGAGTALIGSFSQAAAVWRRGGVTVEISNQHEDYFQRNLVMARAELREALAVYRPSAFCEVRGLS
jgi:HK97 family phage major capsid protein